MTGEYIAAVGRLNWTLLTTPPTSYVTVALTAILLPAFTLSAAGKLITQEETGVGVGVVLGVDVAATTVTGTVGVAQVCPVAIVTTAYLGSRGGTKNLTSGLFLKFQFYKCTFYFENRGVFPQAV